MAYLSEIFYADGDNKDFIEVAVTSGTDLSGYSVVVYDSSGLVHTSMSLGTAVSTVAGKDVYLLNGGTAGFVGFGSNHAVALVDDLGNVLQFVSFKGTTVTATEGAASGLTSTDVGTAGSGASLESTDGGASYQTQTAENAGTIPCYAPGTLIDTPGGPRAVETLRPGDLVLTVDHGAQPIRWVRSGDHPLDGAEENQKPVLIQAGALGSGLPEQDLIVSGRAAKHIPTSRPVQVYCG